MLLRLPAPHCALCLPQNKSPSPSLHLGSTYSGRLSRPRPPFSPHRLIITHILRLLPLLKTYPLNRPCGTSTTTIISLIHYHARAHRHTRQHFRCPFFAVWLSYSCPQQPHLSLPYTSARSLPSLPVDLYNHILTAETTTLDYLATRSAVLQPLLTFAFPPPELTYLYTLASTHHRHTLPGGAFRSARLRCPPTPQCKEDQLLHISRILLLGFTLISSLRRWPLLLSRHHLRHILLLGYKASGRAPLAPLHLPCCRLPQPFRRPPSRSSHLDSHAPYPLLYPPVGFWLCRPCCFPCPRYRLPAHTYTQTHTQTTRDITSLPAAAGAGPPSLSVLRYVHIYT